MGILRALITVVVVVVSLAASSAFAVENALSGVDRVVVMANVNAQTQANGITADYLTGEVETQLRQAGVKLAAKGDASPRLVVNVITTEAGLGSTIVVQLMAMEI